MKKQDKNKVIEIKPGRPRLIENPEMLISEFNKYVCDCIDKNEMPTITGFTLSIGIHKDTYYRTMDEYSMEFADAKKYIDDSLEELTIQNMMKARNPVAYIFYLKNKFGWSDKQEIVSTTTHNYNLNMTLPQIEERIQLAKAELARLIDEAKDKPKT